MLIRSGRELHIAVKRLLGEQHGNGYACPWCKQIGAYEVENEYTSDRLFVSNKIENGRHPIRYICRQALLGTAAHPPVHSVEELFAEFTDETIELPEGTTWATIAREYLTIIGLSSTPGKVEKSKAYWDFLTVLDYHEAETTYEEWQKFGFSKEVIDKLNLGVTPTGRLSIPISHLVPDPEYGMFFDGNYVQRTRIRHGQEPTRYNPKYYWPKNLDPSLWYIDGDQEVCRIMEGDTSTIAAVDIWGEGPIASAQGAGNWYTEYSEYLLSRGLREFHIYTDNDDEGRKYELAIIDAFKIAAKKRGIDWSLLTFKTITWPDDAPDGYDPRQALKDYGEDAGRLLERWLNLPSNQLPHQGRHRATWDSDYARSYYSDDFQQEKETLYDLDALRGIGDDPGLIYREIEEFVKDYKLDEEGHGKLLLMRSTPGVGKSRAAVLYAEQYALAYLERRNRRAQSIIDTLKDRDDLSEKDKKRLEKYVSGNYKKLAVLFVGTFVDGYDDIMRHAKHPELWYNFEARNKETCQNMQLVERIANAGYGVMRTACIDGGLCPLREACQGYVEGRRQYLAQLAELEQQPIVYLRHNHLYMKSLLKKARLIMVDEDPSAIALSPITLTASELRKFDAYRILKSDEDASVVNRFLEAVVTAVETYTDSGKWLSGGLLVSKLHVQHGDKMLTELAEIIVQRGLLVQIAEWKPSNISAAPHGKIVDLLALLVRDTLRKESDWNGQVFIQEGTVTFYPIEPFPIEQKKPVVALDATGMEHKYKLCFDRAVLTFKAEVYPKNATTYIITDSENTMGTFLRGIEGEESEAVALYGVRDYMTLAEKSKPQDFTTLYDIEKVPNPSLREAIRMALGLTAMHGQLLVVTYKRARIFMERFIKEHFPDYYPYISFGHFRALRGLNVFESMPAVLVIGTFRVPTDVMKRDLVAFHKDDPELLDLKTIRKDEYYHGTPWRYSTMTLADSRDSVQDYIYELEAGEIQQVAGRIRAAVSNTPKHIYLMTSRPAMPWMTYNGEGSQHWQEGHLYDPDRDMSYCSVRTAAWWWFEAEQSMRYIRQYNQVYGHYPTIKQLMDYTGYTNYRARKMLEHWNSIEHEP